MSATMTTMEPEKLMNGSDLRDDLIVLDVRTPQEYRESHIPGSINIPLADLPPRVASVRSEGDARPIALVCVTGRRAGLAQGHFEEAGIPDVHVVDGGLVNWQRCSLPVNKGKAGFSLMRQVQLTAGSLIVLFTVLGYTVHPALFGLAGFMGAGLAFAGLTNTCALATLLSRMPWNRAPATSCGI